MLCQAAGCARAASKLHCATSLRRVRACIAQPYGQRRTAVTVERMTSPYVQNLVALATRGGDGEGSGGGGSNQLIYQSFITWGGRGGWGCQTLIHQSLVPSKLSSQSLCFAKQTQGSPYQLPFVKKPNTKPNKNPKTKQPSKARFTMKKLTGGALLPLELQACCLALQLQIIVEDRAAPFFLRESRRYVCRFCPASADPRQVWLPWI